MSDNRTKRARRIHDRNRMKAKARRVAKLRGLPLSNYIYLSEHLAHCSCPMCGNPRFWFGEKTMQERRAPPP